MHRQQLVVELDGAQHWELGQAKYHAQQTRDLELQGSNGQSLGRRKELGPAREIFSAIDWFKTLGINCPADD
jgi:hypothetical protein